VRTVLMRRTLHLVSARDCLRLRPLLEPMLVKRMLGGLGRELPGVDVDELAGLAEPRFAAEPRRVGEVAREIAGRWPDVAPRVLGDALTVAVPLVQVPPRGLWGHGSAPARLTTIEAWLGAAPEGAATADEVVLRHLRAFGPAAAADVRAWSGLTGLRAAIDRLRPRLRTFRDGRGRELLDVEDGPLPDPATAAPARFLPAFDNAVLGFDDRSRIIDAEHRGLSVAGARFVLVDGRVAATWSTERAAGDGPVTVAVAPLRRLGRGERDEVGDEAGRLAAFLGDGAPGRVRIG
jgi:Winged helix DNA-binding domain